MAAQLGSDVPFCLAGGRARVSGVGERVDVLPFQDRRFVLLLPPISVDTGSVYKAWDYLSRQEGSSTDDRNDSGNDLEEAALTVAPQLMHWRDTFAGITGRRPRLAGSGSAWFVEGTPEELDLGKRSSLVLGNLRAPVVAVTNDQGSASIGSGDVGMTSENAAGSCCGFTCRRRASASGWPSAFSCASSCASAYGAF